MLHSKLATAALRPLAFAIALTPFPALAQNDRETALEAKVAQQARQLEEQAAAIRALQQTLARMAPASAAPPVAAQQTATPSGTSPTASAPLEMQPPEVAAAPPAASDTAIPSGGPATLGDGGGSQLRTQTQTDLAAQGQNGSIYGGLASITPVPQTTTLPRGFIPVPGTAAVFRLGGQLQVDWLTFPKARPGESEDLFYPRLINTDPNAVGHMRTRISPRDSRLNVDVRSPSPIGPLRAFVEFDFFGDIPANAQSQLNGYTPRLRHMLIEIGKGRGTGQWLLQLGQTWSTFGDVTTYPNFYNGLPLGAVFVRQPLIRLTYWLNPNTSFSAAVENPQGDILGATGSAAGTQFDHLPDLVGAVRQEFGWGHIQLAGMIRSIDTTTPYYRSTGYGLSANGIVTIPRAVGKGQPARPDELRDGDRPLYRRAWADLRRFHGPRRQAAPQSRLCRQCQLSALLDEEDHIEHRVQRGGYQQEPSGRRKQPAADEGDHRQYRL